MYGCTDLYAGFHRVTTGKWRHLGPIGPHLEVPDCAQIAIFRMQYPSECGPQVPVNIRVA